MSNIVSIVTPVWNKSNLTSVFYQSNWEQLNHKNNVKWVAVNNGSTDDTVAVLSRMQEVMGDRLTVVNISENKGFGGGHNIGASNASQETDIFVHISNDVLIDGDYITPVEMILNIVPNSIVGQSLFRYDTGWNKFGNIIIPYVQGHIVGCKKDVWEDLGGFDERYFPCDYEDLDLSYHAMKKGYSLKQIDIPVRHYNGQTAVQLGDRTNITNKHKALFMEKWGLSE